jgi:hypothetical protein
MAKSSDQRYFQARRPKRDTSHIERWGQSFVTTLRDVRSDTSQFPRLEMLVRESAAEFSQLLLACGRTSHDFRRNFRRGAANWNVIVANDLAAMDDLRRERLDGFSIIRLSREQAQAVKAKWRKLRDQDYLFHDPQGSAWTLLLRSHVLGQRDGLELVMGLRTGKQLALKRFQSAEQAKYAWFRERDLEHRRLSSEQWEWRYDTEQEDEASICFSMALADYQLKWRKPTREPQAKIRARMEHNLLVAEAFVDGADMSKAIFDPFPDTSGRHCSEKRLRERFDRVWNTVGDRWNDIIEAQRNGWG